MTNRRMEATRVVIIEELIRRDHEKEIAYREALATQSLIEFGLVLGLAVVDKIKSRRSR